MTASDTARPPDADQESNLPFPLVGLGASAGGVEALIKFFDTIPADSGCAFLVVLHLSPDQESQLADILARHTAMPVQQARNGAPILPDHVYVIAPGTNLRVEDGRLQVTLPKAPHGHRRPIDELFTSIAHEQQERAIAILLSGTGNNGVNGLRDIRAEGGFNIVQTPETAKFDGMPRSAIAAGMADKILSLEEMPAAVMAYIGHGYVAAGLEPIDSRQVSLEQVVEVLRAQNGHDFRDYKRSTLRRRIHRRMSLRNIETLTGYLADLRSNPPEVEQLVSDMMISVTGFFRDPLAWEILAEQVIAPLVAARKDGAPIRVWVPACATGEEAYSIAILITEQAKAAGKHFDLKVFATDPKEDNLRKGRDGVYPAAALAELAEARATGFFDPIDENYRVTKHLRDKVTFAVQNLLTDPPFSRLDLILCRNLLIHLNAAAQQRIIAQLHSALNPQGYLFLGKADTVASHDNLFEVISKKWRIYRRIGATRHDLIASALLPTSAGSLEAAEPPARQAQTSNPTSVANIARRALLERYAPASVLIDESGQALFFHGATSDYLEQPHGEPTRDVLAMARNGLALKLRSALREAIKTGKTVHFRAQIPSPGRNKPTAVSVIPIPPWVHGSKLTLISFAPVDTATDPAIPRADPEEFERKATGESDFREELNLKRVELRGAIEELETAKEELKASHEKSTSMNEELISTNEELETPKEELNTVNSQLKYKINELEQTTDDLNNLLAGTDTATLFLDHDLAIKWFTPAMGELFDFVAADVGRSIAHFARKFTDDDLLSDARAVLDKLSSIEAEVAGEHGRWYQRRILPYRTRDNHIAGVVINFSDITDRRNALCASEEARNYAEALIATAHEAMLVLDDDLCVHAVNNAFCNLFQVLKDDIVGKHIYELRDGQWNIPPLRTLLEDVLRTQECVEEYEILHDFLHIGTRALLLNGRRILRNNDHEGLILLSITDLTEQRARLVALQQSEQRLQDLINNMLGAVYTADVEGRLTLFNPAAVELFGREPELGVKGWSASWPIFHADGTPLLVDAAPLTVALRDNTPIKAEEFSIRHPNGRLVPFLVYLVPTHDADGKVSGAICVLVDISERKQAEAVAQRLSAIVESSDDAIISKTPDGILTSWNASATELLGHEANDVIGKSVMIIVPEHLREQEKDIMQQVRQDKHVRRVETQRLRGDGSLIWVSMTISAIHNDAGQVTGISNIMRDMTARRQSQQHRATLMRELNHRVKNSMAVVQAIASQTLSNAASLKEARDVFSARLLNLAKAHDLLTRESWQSANLRDIIADAIQPHQSAPSRFDVVPPPGASRIRLQPSAALGISMAMHELCTNAAKYGALSQPQGRITISWEIESDNSFRLCWQERGGPEVTAPKRKGFGSRLIERAITGELGGEVRIDYAPAGLQCTIRAPLPPEED